jgi:hypothetical protein
MVEKKKQGAGGAEPRAINFPSPECGEGDGKGVVTTDIAMSLVAAQPLNPFRRLRLFVNSVRRKGMVEV